MYSKLAMDDIREMKDGGIDLPPEDIIRLNALGLKVEHADTSDTLFTAPRVALLCGVAIHEPTVQVDIWMKEVAERICADQDTCDALQLYALAHARVPGFFENPDLRDEKKIAAAVLRWRRENIPLATQTQTAAAMDYAIFGTDSDALEIPIDCDDGEAETAVKKDLPKSTLDLIYSLVNAAISRNLGIPLADLMTVTQSNLYGIIMRAAMSGNLKSSGAKTQASGDYLKTLSAFKKKYQNNQQPPAEAAP